MAVMEAIRTGGPQIKTKLPGPNAARAVKEDARIISPSYTRSYPLVAKKGSGALIEDVDGNVFLDFAAGIAVCSTGHCHPEVVSAIQKQAAELIHMSGTDFYYESMVTLADRLSKSAPMKGPHRVYYGNSGTEAVECAMKLARYHTQRPHIIAFYNAFHGRTMGALSLTASKPQQRRRFMPLVPGVTHVPYPHSYRRPAGTDAKQYAIDCARFIEDKVFKTTVPPEECAAIILETVQGEGGYVPAPKEFLQEIRSICDRHGIMMICDEVQSGAGRTGKMWAVQHSGVEPDMITSAKGIASGMPLGVVITKADVMDWVPGSHASTFGGNPVCIASALATLDVLEREGIANAAKVGDYMKERVKTWVDKYEIVGDVRGMGLMIGIEIVKDKKTKAVAGKERDRIVDQLCFERGVLMLGCGETTIRLSPPLIITKEQADIAMDVLEECIAIVNKENGSTASAPGKQTGA
jgi:4-aminobutyrate aminotransferase